MANKVIGLRLPDEIYQKLLEDAKPLGFPVPQVIKYILAQYYFDKKSLR